MTPSNVFGTVNDVPNEQLLNVTKLVIVPVNVKPPSKFMFEK